jgi:uncharacterized RDD family membrane protein YckC
MPTRRPSSPACSLIAERQREDLHQSSGSSDEVGMDFPASTPPPSFASPTPPAAPRPTAPVEDLKKLDGKRVLARLIDGLIIGVPSTVAALAEDEGAYWIFVAFSLIYFFICEATLAQTLGKKAMGLRVMTRDGAAPSVNAVSVRTVLRLIDDGPVGLVVMVASGKRRQRIGDLLAGTTVGRAVGEVPKPRANPLLAVYPAAWLIGAIVFITLPPSAASADEYRQKATAICQSVGDREPAEAEWTGIMQRMYDAHAALTPPDELKAVHAALVRTDADLLKVFQTIDAAHGNQKVVRQVFPIEIQALEERDRLVGPTLPGCAGSDVK